MSRATWRLAPLASVLALACNGTVPVGNTGLSGGTGPDSDTGDGATTGTPDPTTGADSTGPGVVGSTGAESSGSDGGMDTPKLDVPVPDPPAADFPQTCDEAEAAESSVGCVFYPIYLPFVTNGLVGFAASNVSDEVAHVELFDADGIVDSADVQPGEIHMFERDDTYRATYGNTEIGNAGYELVSDHPLQVFSFMPYTTTLVTNDASIIYPASALGTRHRIANFENQGPELPSQHVTVVATEDGTEVTFSLVNAGAVTYAGGTIPALDFDAGDDTVTVTLDRLEHLVISATEWIEDSGPNPFYGSLVESNAPVAVYSGVGSLQLNSGANDLVQTAVPPTTVFGTRYAAAKFIPVGNAPDIWRFVANADGTEIVLSGGVQDTIELDAGEIYDLWTSASFWAEGNEPFGLLHVMTGATASPPLIPHDCDSPISGPGDPAIGWVFAQENWLNRYLMPVGQGSLEDDADEWCHNHLTVVAPLDDWDDIEVNGVPLPEPLDIGHDDFGFTYVPAPAGTHELVAPDGVGVQVDVYGFHHHGSYFYPGGMGLKDINPEG